MGSSFSQQINEVKEQGENCFTVEGVKLKHKDAPVLLKKLYTELPNLTQLEVKSCKLKHIPPNLKIFAELEVLKVTENRLTQIPSDIATLPNLVKVDFTKNSFSRFPVEICKFVNLRIANFSRNEISTFPAPHTYKDYQYLETIILEENMFTSFPIQMCSIETLTSINLNNNKISSIPKEIGRLQNLTELFLKGNQLTEIPNSIDELKKLQHFDCSENHLRTLPLEFKNLNTITTLELQHNQFDIIPLGICNLFNLSILKMHGNQITSIPPEISNLINLAEFSLQENKIATLPLEIGKLVNLRKLYLEYNQLTSLPNEIANLKKLIVLILHHNQISKLPSSFSEMTSLLRLSLNDNPLGESILTQIQQKGALSLIANPEEEQVVVEERSAFKKRSSFRRRTLVKGEFEQFIANNSENNISNNNNNNNNNSNTNISPEIVSKPVRTGSFAKPKEQPHPLNSRRSKDAETGVPDYEEFKEAFNSTLRYQEEQDFSQKKKEMLRKLPDADKWTLLNQYKGSTLQLLRNQSQKGTSRGSTLKKKTLPNQAKGPKEFLVLLKEGRMNKNSMSRLKSSLCENSGNWLSKFIDSGGIPILTQSLHTLCARRSNAIRDLSMINDCLEVFSLLLASSMKSVLTSSGAVNAIGMALSSSDSNKYLAITLFYYICEEAPNIGSEIVSEAIYQYSQHFQEEFRYFPIFQIMEIPDSPSVVRLHCLAIINDTVNSIDDLNSRFSIRMEIMQMGFRELLNQLRNEEDNPMIELQCSIFDEDTNNDYEDMRYELTQQAKIAHHQDDRIIIYVFTENIQSNFSQQIDDLTTTQNIISAIVSQFKIRKPEEYGLYSSYQGTEKSLLPSEKIKNLIASCPTATIEYKLLPWELIVELPDHSSAAFACNPCLTCREVVHQIVESYNLNPEIEYHISLNPENPFDDFRLLASVQGMEIPLNRSKLILKEKPIECKVYFGNDTWQVLQFDSGETVDHLMEKILRTSNILTDQDKYSLVLEKDQFSTVLDQSQNIENYSLRDSSNFRLVLSKVTNTESGEEEQEVEECNIWEEPPDSKENITFEANKDNTVQNIETATLNILIQRLTSPDEYSGEFVNFFVMMYQGFITDEKLFAKLEERFDVPSIYDQNTKMKVQARVAIYLKYWIERMQQRISPAVLASITRFVKEKMCGPQFELTSRVILERLQKPKNADSQVHSIEKAPPPHIPKAPPPYSFLDLDETEVARQLTILSYNIYKNIKATEFFKLAWSKEKYMHLAPNIIAMIENYNMVSRWVATSIVLVPKLRDRSKLCQKLINIAEKLRELNNFHLVSAFVSAFSNSSILRLKFTKARLSRRHQTILSDLETLLEMKGSFSKYRAALESSKPPCIPFLGVYLTDLVFVTDGNPDYIGKRINVFKHKFIFQVINLIQKYQAIPYSLETVDPIQQFFTSLKCYDDNQLHAISLQLEPRGADRSQIQ